MSKVVGDKVKWCVKDGVSKMVCERWRVKDCVVKQSV